MLVIPIAFTLDAKENASTLAALRRDTSSLSTLLANDISHNHVVQAKRLATSYARTTGRQVLILDGTGTLFASKQNQALDATLIKIARTVGDHQISGVIPRTAIEGPQYYVAMRLPFANNVTDNIDHVVLVVTFPVTIVTKTIHSDWRNLAIFGAVLLLLAFILGVVISNSLTRPLRRISAAVDDIGNGQLDERAPVDDGPPELRRLAETINSTSSRLINLLAAQKSFVEDASHQLRTPLTALQLHIENLLDQNHAPRPEDSAAILTELSRLNHLVDSLLALARNESRRPVLGIVDVAAIARERATYWKPFVEEHAITLELESPPNLYVSVIDGVIEQVLDNLLSNAMDATPGGGRILISAASGTKGHVELHVIDNGVGLGPEERVLALRRFWRGRENTAEGTGLGLAIVDQLIRLSGGTIELQAASGGGIDAVVTLPTASAHRETQLS